MELPSYGYFTPDKMSVLFIRVFQVLFRLHADPPVRPPCNPSWPA